MAMQIKLIVVVVVDVVVVVVVVAVGFKLKKGSTSLFYKLPRRTMVMCFPPHA